MELLMEAEGHTECKQALWVGWRQEFENIFEVFFLLLWKPLASATFC